MSHQERRRSPRKECLVPLRFRILDNGNGHDDTVIRLTDYAAGAGTHAHFGMAEGQAENLSERGVYFVSRERVTVGEDVELFLTIPAELTGRADENVRCSARVVYAQPVERDPSLTGVGVCVRCFEPVVCRRNWAN